MPIERIKGFFIFILIGVVIIYIIYRTYNRFSKKDIPFKASAEIDLVILLVTLAFIVILW
jgi:predicted PurR-regulated permease PerM